MKKKIVVFQVKDQTYMIYLAKPAENQKLEVVSFIYVKIVDKSSYKLLNGIK